MTPDQMAAFALAQQQQEQEQAQAVIPGAAALSHIAPAQGAAAPPPSAVAPPPMTPATDPSLAGPPVAKQLVVNPQQPAGQAPGQGTDPRLLALAATPPGAGVQSGPTALDKNYLETLKQQAGDTADALQANVQQNQQIADNVAQQTEDYGKQTDAATMAFQAERDHEKQARAELQQHTEESQQRIQQQLAALDARGIDPNHYWRDKSTATKIGAALLVGLGGIGAGLNAHLGGRNTALDIINGAVADDIDAQKANLALHMNVLDKRMGLEKDSFERQNAMLQAERESTQTGYAIVQNQLSKKLAAFKDNADFQQRGAELSANLMQAAQDKIAHINEQSYALQKRFQPTGGGQANTAQKLRETAFQIQREGEARGVPVEWGDALKRAANVVIGTDYSTPSLAKPLPNAGGSKAAGQLASLDSAEKALTQLIQMRQRAPMLRGPDMTAQGQALANAARTAYAAGMGARVNEGSDKLFQNLIPDDPLAHTVSGIVGADPIAMRLRGALTSVQRQRAALIAHPGAAVGDSGGGEEAQP